MISRGTQAPKLERYKYQEEKRALEITRHLTIAVKFLKEKAYTNIMFGSTFSLVLNLVQEWNPGRRYSGESGFRDDLLKFLRNNLNRPDDLFGLSEEHSIRKESGRHLADIAVNGQIGIELKYNLNTKAKTDRLFGQIDDYLKGYDRLIIVLCGKTNEEHLDYLKEKVRKMRTDTFFSSSQVEIVVKDSRKRRKERDSFRLF